MFPQGRLRLRSAALYSFIIGAGGCFIRAFLLLILPVCRKASTRSRLAHPRCCQRVLSASSRDTKRIATTEELLPSLVSREDALTTPKSTRHRAKEKGRCVGPSPRSAPSSVPVRRGPGPAPCPGRGGAGRARPGPRAGCSDRTSAFCRCRRGRGRKGRVCARGRPWR